VTNGRQIPFWLVNAGIKNDYTARRVFPEARVIAIEPDPGNARVLRRNCSEDTLVTVYGKGVLTKGLLSKLIGRARGDGIPVLVDPARSRCWFDYGQVSLIKANWVNTPLKRP